MTGMNQEQLALFEMPPPVDRTHDWHVRPFGPSECACCLLLWFPGASHADVRAFLTGDCPVKALDAPQAVPVIVYLTGA
jgi:hypothetical protein